MKIKSPVPILLILIFLLALAVRFYKLDLLPIYADETGHYYVLRTIISRQPNPLIWLYNTLHWRTFTLVWLFGLTPLGVRFMPALYSAALSLIAFFFSASVNKDKKTALLTALLVGVSPWSFMIGRIGHTSIPILLILIILHAYLFLKGNTLKYTLASLLFLALAATYYPSMVVIAPLILSLVTIQIVKNIAEPNRPKFYFVSLITIFFLLFGTLKLFRVFSTSERAFDLAIWRDVNTTYDTDKYRGLSWNSTPTFFSFFVPPEQLANKFFLNRVTANLTVFTKNYLSFFSPDWLFLRGDGILRHSTGMVGTFYPFLLPFLFYGAYRFFKTHDQKTRIFFLFWILVSPIPAAITKDGAGYLLRAVTMLPFLTYFCALGITESFRLITNRLRIFYCLALVSIGVYFVWSFYYGYFHVYPALSSRSYEYGFKELSDFQKANGGKTMLIVWDGYYPVGHFLFWQKVPFLEYEAMKITPTRIGETTFWRTLPNLYFAVPKVTKNVADFIKTHKPAYLVLPDRYFVKYSDDLLELTKERVGQVNYPDQTTAFSVYTLK